MSDRDTNSRRELRFYSNASEDALELLGELAAKGCRRIMAWGDPTQLRPIIEASRHRPETSPLTWLGPPELAGLLLPIGGWHSFPAVDVDAVFLCGSDPAELSSLLLKLSSYKTTICAPISEHFFTCRPAFVNSVPKSGTHMLFALLRSFGLQDPASLDLPGDDEALDPGHYYNLQHMTREHLARPYFRIASLVNRLAESVILFLIRDPRDIAVSLAHYLASQGDYHILASAMRNKKLDERISAVITGAYPLPVYINRNLRHAGSLRELMLLYGDWVREPLPNTLLLRYEDLAGGTDAQAQRRQLDEIWRIQLALHVPGCPESFVDAIRAGDTLTFRRGVAGSYQDEFDARHKELIDTMALDYLELFGYAGADAATHRANARAMEQRTPPVFKGCIDLSPGVTSPQWLEVYEDCNLVFFGTEYFALPRSLGPIDLVIELEQGFPRLSIEGGPLRASTRSEIKRLVDERHHAAEPAPALEPA